MVVRIKIFSDSQWGDLLTSYDGTAITYDAIGNPLSYYNGSAYTFTWEGRRLVGAVKGSKTMSFTYNNEGLRTSKTVNGATTTYLYDGSVLIAEYAPTYTCVYIYDEAGAIIGAKYISTAENSTWQTYFFEKNLQGDVIAVYSDTGTKLISYRYDAWGNTTTTYSNGGASTLAANNRITYRGYYYDSDLGMYYLQSRYYDAKICRFINADVFISTGQGLTGYNMFAYCGNNPVNRVDPTGESWKFVDVVVAVLAVVAFVAAPAVTVGINLYKICKSNLIVANNHTPAMGDEFDNYTDSDAPTYGMTIDEKMAYIRRYRLKNLETAKNWSEAAMLREMEYHETGYRIAVFFGSDPDVNGTLAYSLKHVDFEEEQSFITYLRRFVGNLLPWGIN